MKAHIGKTPVIPIFEFSDLLRGPATRKKKKSIQASGSYNADITYATNWMPLQRM